jgi:hypothetical protein
MGLPAAVAFLAKFLRQARFIREEQGDASEDDVTRRARAAEEELDEIEEDEEEG